MKKKKQKKSELLQLTLDGNYVNLSKQLVDLSQMTLHKSESNSILNFFYNRLLTRKTTTIKK